MLGRTTAELTDQIAPFGERPDPKAIIQAAIAEGRALTRIEIIRLETEGIIPETRSAILRMHAEYRGRNGDEAHQYNLIEIWEQIT